MESGLIHAFQLNEVGEGRSYDEKLRGLGTDFGEQKRPTRKIEYFVVGIIQ